MSFRQASLTIASAYFKGSSREANEGIIYRAKGQVASSTVTVREILVFLESLLVEIRL